MIDMMETAVSDTRIAWLAATLPNGDRCELAYTPGVPVAFIKTTS